MLILNTEVLLKVHSCQPVSDLGNNFFKGLVIVNGSKPIIIRHLNNIFDQIPYERIEYMELLSCLDSSLITEEIWQQVARPLHNIIWVKGRP